MLQTTSRLLPELPLFLMTAVATHLVMSFAQTLMHYKLGHHPMGGKFFRNHINFHHTYYSKDHLVSRTYLGDHGNNTPFFFIPVFLVGACTYLVLPFDLFVVQVVACAASFYTHVFFDKEYHVQGSRLQRFAWFRRKEWNPSDRRSGPISAIRGGLFRLIFTTSATSSVLRHPKVVAVRRDAPPSGFWVRRAYFAPVTCPRTSPGRWAAV